MNEFKSNLDKEAMNKLFNNSKSEAFKCAICGKLYETISDRNICETKCLKERAAAEEALKKEKLEKEKAARKEEIEKKYAELNEMIKLYVKDYGKISFNRSVSDYPTLSKLFDFWTF